MTTSVVDRPELFKPEALLPLGRRFGAERPTPDEAGRMPFGANLAVKVQSTPVDLASIIYDPDRQISMVDDGGVLVPVLKHSTGTTSTNTARDDAGPGDSDTDATED